MMKAFFTPVCAVLTLLWQEVFLILQCSKFVIIQYHPVLIAVAFYTWTHIPRYRTILRHVNFFQFTFDSNLQNINDWNVSACMGCPRGVIRETETLPISTSPSWRRRSILKWSWMSRVDFGKLHKRTQQDMNNCNNMSIIIKGEKGYSMNFPKWGLDDDSTGVFGNELVRRSVNI